MDIEGYRREWAVDGLGYLRGYYPHSSICTCEPCTLEYETHQKRGCNCVTCQRQRLNRNVPYHSNEQGETQMAGVQFCDRCESMGKATAMGRLVFHMHPMDGGKSLELCPGCVGDMVDFLEHDVMTEREKGYREPYQPGDKTPEEKGDFLTDAVRRAMREELRQLGNGD